MIALTIALEHPERVERLVVVDSLGRMMYSRGRSLLVLLSRLLPFRMFVAVNIRRAFKRGFPSAEVARYVAQAQCTPRQVVLGCFAAMRRFDVLDHVSELRLPMLILHGFYNVQFPLRQALDMAVRVPGSLVKVLDTGHEAPAENPEAVTQAVECFVRPTCSADNPPPQRTSDVQVRQRCIDPAPPRPPSGPVAGHRALPPTHTPECPRHGGRRQGQGGLGGAAGRSHMGVRCRPQGSRDPWLRSARARAWLRGLGPPTCSDGQGARTPRDDVGSRPAGLRTQRSLGPRSGHPVAGLRTRRDLDAPGLERVVLVGNSIGGPVCLEVAHSAPERVAGIVLASPAVRMHNQPLARALVQLTRDVRHEDSHMAPSLPDYVRFGPLNALQCSALSDPLTRTHPPDTRAHARRDRHP